MNRKCKLNILDPWESGTASSIDAYIVKEKENEFLLYVEEDINVRGTKAHYFICELKNREDKTSLKNDVKKVYPINLVFDKNIVSNNQDFPGLNSYRANLLSGEIIN